MTESETAPILIVDDLTVAYQHDTSWLKAVQDFSLTIYPGQTVGLVGESGSGKSTVALAIMDYLGAGGQVQKGSISFLGRDLLGMDEKSLQQVWGLDLALVPQDPLSSLNPSMKVGEQLVEILRHHSRLGRDEADKRGLELLEMVRVPDPERAADSYPHQISGGMQQRILIAMALSTEPKLLILDEPTTALDVTTQAAILDLLRELIHQRNTAALYVTHNLGVVASISDRVSVLYAGELVEEGDTRDIFLHPLHPYTQGLLASVPRLGDSKRSSLLEAIPGRIPSLRERLDGCLFAPRCSLAVEVCGQRPFLDQVNANRVVRCHRWSEISEGLISSRSISPRLPTPQYKTANSNSQTVLNLDKLEVTFKRRRSFSDALAGKPNERVKAVDGVDLSIRQGKTLGLVGESGSGKTSLARAIIGLERATGGEMKLLDFDLPPGLKHRDREMMGHLQIVFQNPDDALNPYHTVGETLQRPLVTLRKLSPSEVKEAVPQLLAMVSLPAAYAQRGPDQLSGGEKQRVAIARAFAASPDLLISDEPVSALDVSVQASILNMLNELQEKSGASNLFISHNIAVVGYLADEIAVMYAGGLMEIAPAETLFAPPHHPYTEALLSAVPNINPDILHQPIPIEGEVPDQISLPTGCRFHPRCPRFQGDICINETPPWQADEKGKQIQCHIPLVELEKLQVSQ